MVQTTATKTWTEKLKDDLEEVDSRRTKGKMVSRPEDRTWEDDRMVRSAMVVGELAGFTNMKVLHAFIAEMEPSGHSGKHTHTSEAIMLCLSGSGYSVIDGERFDWAEGDVIVMPAYTVHQHFNASDTEIFRFYTVSDYPLTSNLGLSRMDMTEPGSHATD